jgi:hypothetical protein
MFLVPWLVLGGTVLFVLEPWLSRRSGGTHQDRGLATALWPDLATVRFFLRRGLTIPAIFLLSIAISFFSVSVAIFSWLVMLAVDAFVIHRRFR